MFVGSMLLIFFVLCVVLLCVLMFWVPVPYDFRIKTMFGSSLPPVICSWAHVVCVFVCRNESGRFGALKSDSTHHFFRNACTKSEALRFSQFSGCWLILSVCILMSFDFPFVRLLGVLLLPLYSSVQHILFVLLFCFSPSCVPYDGSFSVLSFFDCPLSIFSNLYLLLLVWNSIFQQYLRFIS